MNSNPLVTIIIPCRNEERYIANCLNSVILQDYPEEKMEVFVIDGQSNDKTGRIIEDFASTHSNIRNIKNPDKITAKAFNLGIKNSSGSIVTICSAHSVLGRNYVSKCIEYLEKTGADEVGGPMRAVGESYVSKAIALVYNSPFGLGGGNAHNERFEGEAEGVYPGCWPRRVFEKIGLFDERLVRNQDIEFESRLRKSGGRIYLTPDIKVYYYCRPSLNGLWKQNLANGIWNIRMAQICPGNLSLRHFVPLFFIVALLTTWIIKPVWFSIVLSYLFCSAFFSLKAAIENGVKYLFILPIVFLTLHLSYGLGLLVGIFCRIMLKR